MSLCNYCTVNIYLPCVSLFPLLGVAVPALRIEALAFDSDSQEDENVAVAETQSFVLQSGACRASCSDGDIRGTTQACGPATTEDGIIKQSCGEELFRLGLSDSSHLQDPLQAPAMESTQAFVSVEATQLYEASSHANQTSSTNHSQLEATQAYGEEEEEEEKEPAICSGGGDLSLEPTQAYVSEPYHDSDETDDDEKRAVAPDEAQPFDGPTSATLATAETQPMCASKEEEEEEEVVKFPVSFAGQVKVGSESERGERGEHRGAAASQERPFREVLSLAETQPMSTSHDWESDEEDSFPRRRKRKTKQLQSEDEQTQPLTSPEQSLVQMQPLQSADETPAPPGREAFQEEGPVAVLPNSQTLQKKPALVTSDLAETQLMITGEDEESEESVSFLIRPRRTAKPLRQLEEETHTPIVPEAFGCDTQPMDSSEDGGGEDSLPGPGRTRAKPVLIPKEKTQPLANPESSETPLLEAEAESGGSKRGTRARSRNVSTRLEEPSRRRTRGRKDVVAAAPRARSKSGGDERKEEEEHPKEAGGRKSRRQRNDVENKEPDISPEKNQGEPSLGEKRSESDLQPHLRESEEERKEPGEEMEPEQIHLEIKEEKERIEAESAQTLRLEWERAEKEKMERERKEQEERAEKQKDTEQKEREDKGRLEHERAERGDEERLEGERNARMSSGRKEQEKKEMLESERREHDDREVQHHSARQESEAEELDSVGSSEKGKKTEEKILQEQKEEDRANVSARGRRAARRTAAAAANEDVPARRTRSRSNSSNSVSSERSASSVSTQESRGRGRGARRSADPPHALASRSSTRRRTVARHPTQADSKDASGGLFTSDSSLNQRSQGRGRGGRQPPGGRAAAAGPVSLAASQGQPKTATRGRKINKPDSSHEREKADSQEAAASRGQWRASSNGSETAEAEGRCRADEESNQKVRGRSCKAAKSGVVLVPGSPAASHLELELKKGRKRECEANSEDGSGASSKIFKEEDKEPASGEAGEAAKHPAQTEVPVLAKRRGRASAAQTKTALRAAEAGPGVKDRTAEEEKKKKKKTEAEPEDTDASAEQHERVLLPEVAWLLPLHTCHVTSLSD